nr:uncharacterized protein LOC110150522 isoform X1 [Odocoileus virginianus texanus]
MNGWTPSGTGSQTTWGGNPRPEKGKDLPRVPHRPVQPPHWSLCLLMLRSTQLDPRSGPVQIPSWCSGLPAHRAGPRSLGSGAAALAPGASSRLSQRDRGCEGSGAFSRDADARHHCLGRELSCLFPGKRLHGRGPVSWQRTSLMSGGPDRRLSPSSRCPVARWPPQLEVEVSTHFREPLPLGLWTSCGSGTQLRRRMCVPPAASQAAV